MQLSTWFFHRSTIIDGSIEKWFLEFGIKISYESELKNRSARYFRPRFFNELCTARGHWNFTQEKQKVFWSERELDFFRKSLSSQMKFRWLELFQRIRSPWRKSEKGQNNRLFFARDFSRCRRLINSYCTIREKFLRFFNLKKFLAFFSAITLSIAFFPAFQFSWRFIKIPHTLVTFFTNIFPVLETFWNPKS